MLNRVCKLPYKRNPASVGNTVKVTALAILPCKAFPVHVKRLPDGIIGLGRYPKLGQRLSYSRCRPKVFACRCCANHKENWHLSYRSELLRCSFSQARSCPGFHIARSVRHMNYITEVLGLICAWSVMVCFSRCLFLQGTYMEQAICRSSEGVSPNYRRPMSTSQGQGGS